MGLLFAMTIPGLAVALFVLAVVDRVLHRRGRRLVGGDRGAGSTGIDELTALMYAGKRAELDQRATATLLREDVGEGAPLRVDPATGRATVRVPGPTGARGA